MRFAWLALLLLPAVAAGQSSCAFSYTTTLGPYLEAGPVSATMRLQFASSGCPWSASTDSPDMTVEPASGVSTGSDVVFRIALAANRSASARRVTLTMRAGSITPAYSVLQNSTACALSVAPTELDFPWSGGTATLDVSVAPAACWGAVSQIPAWMRLVPANTDYRFVGSTRLQFAATANTGAARRDVLTAGPQPLLSIPVSQAGPPAGSLTISGALPQAVAGVAVNERFVANGGTPPYSWTAAGLPVGLGIGPATGVLGGTAPEPGNYAFTVSVTDSSSERRSVSQSFFLTLLNCYSSSAQIPSPLLGPEATTTRAILNYFGAGCPWSVSSNHPALTTRPTSGVTQGAFLALPIEIAENTTADARLMTLLVNVPPMVDYPISFHQNSPACSYSLEPESVTIPASGGSGSFHARVSPPSCWGQLRVPAWMRITSPDFKPFPVFTGAATVQYTVEPNAGPARATAVSLIPAPASSARFTVSQDGIPAALSVASRELPDGTAGRLYFGGLEAAGGVPPYTWKAAELPPGLAVDPRSGALSGVPTRAGVFQPAVTVADSNAATASRSLQMTVLAGAGSGTAITSVTSASGFGGMLSFASGSWIEIKGSGLAKSTRTWTTDDFTGSTAPTSLDGTSVTINGKPAFVYYVSPTQVNVQAPDDPATGPVQVRVNASEAVVELTASKEPRVPGLLAPPAFQVGGRQYLVSQFEDGVFVGNRNLVAGAEFRPAKPGDALTVYGIGFGTVTPEVPAGTAAPGSTSLVGVAARFGDALAEIKYAGLAPGAVGLYQFNLVVPQVPDGDWPVEFEVNGVKAQQRLYLTVRRSPLLSWDFTSGLENWQSVNITSSRIVDGQWVFNAGADPYVVGPPISVAASEYKYVHVRMQAACRGSGAIYFKTTGNDYGPSRRVGFDISPGADALATFVIPMEQNPEWTPTATVTGIRLDPCDAGPGEVRIDYIRLSPAP